MRHGRDSSAASRRQIRCSTLCSKSTSGTCGDRGMFGTATRKSATQMSAAPSATSAPDVVANRAHPPLPEVDAATATATSRASASANGRRAQPRRHERDGNDAGSAATAGRGPRGRRRARASSARSPRVAVTGTTASRGCGCGHPRSTATGRPSLPRECALSDVG